MSSSSSKQYLRLKDKWSSQHKELQHRLWTKHGDALDYVKGMPQQMLIGTLASLLMFSHSVPQNILAQNIQQPENKIEIGHTQEQLISTLKEQLPDTVQPLSVEKDSKIGKVLSDYFGLPVWAVLGGHQLNRTYGYIGAEQHLMRYPGDTMDTHFATAEEAAATGASGMAPGRGAWGYFAQSSSMTQKEIDREKYYIAVQTFLSPGWDTNSSELSKFFKYRKMLIVNPDNGSAMVVVIGDSGPAAFTGKHLGGSPEVMKYLDRHDGAQKGPVLYYFIDDPEDTVPLGPIAVK